MYSTKLWLHFVDSFQGIKWWINMAVILLRFLVSFPDLPLKVLFFLYALVMNLTWLFYSYGFMGGKGFLKNVLESYQFLFLWNFYWCLSFDLIFIYSSFQVFLFYYLPIFSHLFHTYNKHSSRNNSEITLQIHTHTHTHVHIPLWQNISISFTCNFDATCFKFAIH